MDLNLTAVSSMIKSMINWSSGFDINAENNTIGDNANTISHTISKTIKHSISDDSNNTDNDDEIVDVVSDGAIVYVYTIVLGFMCACLSLFGIVTNIINIRVFVSQGFQETINISLLALAVSDLLSLVSLLFVSICFMPFLLYSDLPVLFLEFQQFTGAWTHILFTRITGLITVFITFERCLCIAFPFKVKSMLNPRRVKIIIVCIYTLVLGNGLPNYFGSYLGWKFVPSLNRTVLGNVPTKYSGPIFKFATATQPFYPVFSFTTVVVCTYILVTKLSQRSKWLQSNATSGGVPPAAAVSGGRRGALSETKATTSEKTTSGRDSQVIKMVVHVSIIFIISYTPSLTLFVAMLCLPQFFHGLKLENSFSVTLSISFVFEAINSSVNIFVYLKTSSNYRTHFQSITQSCRSTPKQ